MTSIPDIFGTMAYGPAPEAVAPAQAWLEQHGRRFGLFIGGEWREGEGETFETLNPATGKPLATLTQATAGDVDRAVRAARKAQPGWWELGGHGRARHLYAIARQVQKHSRLFAVLETLDNGKPIRESRDIDIPLVARHFYYHAGWAQLMARELPGREPYTVETKLAVPVMKSSWVFAGSTVEVLVDPDDPERVAIDWEGEHTPGTAAETIMDSPHALEAIRGMGLDPQQVAREADDARTRALAEQEDESR